MPRTPRRRPGRRETATTCVRPRRSGRSPAVGSRAFRLGRLRLRGQEELPLLGVVVEQLGVAAPIDGGVELADGFLFAEVFVEDVVKELVGDGVGALGGEGAGDLADQGDVIDGGLAEELL